LTWEHCREDWEVREHLEGFSITLFHTHTRMEIKGKIVRMLPMLPEWLICGFI